MVAQTNIGPPEACVETRPIANGDGFLARVALKPCKGTATIVAAGYDADSGKVALTLDNGRALSLTAGQHIEEAEEW